MCIGPAYRGLSSFVTPRIVIEPWRLVSEVITKPPRLINHSFCSLGTNTRTAFGTDIVRGNLNIAFKLVCRALINGGHALID
jgi:hypothetical protein